MTYARFTHSHDALRMQKSPYVMEDHEFDLNLMVQTRGFTHCHEL